MLSVKTFHSELTVAPIIGKHENLLSKKCSEFSFTRTVEELKFFPNYSDLFTSTSSRSKVFPPFCGAFLEGYGKVVAVVILKNFNKIFNDVGSA